MVGRVRRVNVIVENHPDEKGGKEWRMVIPNGFVKDGLQASLSERGTFDVFDGPDILSNLVGPFPIDGLHSLDLQGFPGVGVFSKIKLRADQDDRNVGRMMFNLGIPLGCDDD